MMKKVMASIILLTSWITPFLQAAENQVTLSVKHLHFIGSEYGQLTIDEDRMIYESEEDNEHSREWNYTGIQQIKIDSSTQLEVLTYEDVWWKLNRDHRYKFEVADGWISPGLIELLRKKLSSVVVTAVFPEPKNVSSTLPAKHRHSLGGGCNGELLLNDRGVYYLTSNREHSRFWPLNVIESVGKQSSFEFRITVREQNLLGDTRNFQFQLKRPLDEEAYQQLWRRIYEPESWLSRSRGDDHSGF